MSGPEYALDTGFNRGLNGTMDVGCFVAPQAMLRPLRFYSCPALFLPNSPGKATGKGLPQKSRIVAFDATRAKFMVAATSPMSGDAA